MNENIIAIIWLLGYMITMSILIQVSDKNAEAKKALNMLMLFNLILWPLVLLILITFFMIQIIEKINP